MMKIHPCLQKAPRYVKFLFSTIVVRLTLPQFLYLNEAASVESTNPILCSTRFFVAQ